MQEMGFKLKTFSTILCPPYFSNQSYTPRSHSTISITSCWESAGRQPERHDEVTEYKRWSEAPIYFIFHKLLQFLLNFVAV